MAFARLETLVLRRRTGVFTRVGRAEPNPLLECRNHIVAQLVFGRHGRNVRFVAEHSDQRALLEVVRDEHRARIAAAHHARGRIQLQSAFDFLTILGVAFVTMLDQHRLDLRVEQLDTLGVRCLALRLFTRSKRC